MWNPWAKGGWCCKKTYFNFTSQKCRRRRQTPNDDSSSHVCAVTDSEFSMGGGGHWLPKRGIALVMSQWMHI